MKPLFFNYRGKMITVNIEVRETKTLKDKEVAGIEHRDNVLRQYVLAAVEILKGQGFDIEEAPFGVTPSLQWRLLPNKMHMVLGNEGHLAPTVLKDVDSGGFEQHSLCPIYLSFDPNFDVPDTTVDMLVSPDYY